MIRFLVLYQRPTDADAFDRHYYDIHVPLTKKLPGVRNYTVSRNASAVRGPELYYLVAELEWDDMASLQRDFASPLGQELAEDVDKLAELCQGIHSMIFEPESM
jgi:uncharacterized protein (TIGR02118 family)